ncbi:MAG TPA: ATP-binding protein, partial [Actinomycetota bacterium]|nr:ATP-binding protein [Actinomycetota bacterium]
LDRLIFQVEDRGLIDNPLAGRVRPAPDGEHGYGLWLVNQICDLVQIRSGPAGTVVRLHIRTS